MNDEQREQFLHFIIALAWTDGDMDPAERDYLKELVSRVGFDDVAVRKRAEGWLFSRPDEPNWDTIIQDKEMGHTLLRQSMLLAALDMEVSQREMRYLNELRDRLEISEQDFFGIQREVERALVARINK